MSARSKSIFKGLAALALALSVALTAVVPALAEKLYVRDLVIINLRAEPTREAETLGLLRTGDSFEVLAEEGRYLHVRNEAGEQGWIDKQYAVPEPPSLLHVRKAQEDARRLARELEEANGRALKAETELADALSQLSDERREGVQKMKATSSEAGGLKKELAKLKKKYDALLAKSGNVIEIDAERERLAQQNTKLGAELETLGEEAESLGEAYAVKWFFAGAGVLVVGWVIGIMTGKKKKNRAYS